MAVELTDFFKLLQVDTIIQYLKEAALFYFKPIFFLRQLSRRDLKEIIKQILFYYAIFISSLLLFADKELKYIVKYLTIGISIQLAIDVVPLFIGVYFTRKVFKINQNSAVTAVESILYLLLLYVFLIPFSIIPLIIFYKTQEYEFLLIFTVITTIIFYIKNAFYAKVFFDKTKQVALAVFTTFIVFNLIAIAGTHLPTFDKYSSKWLSDLLQGDKMIDPVEAEYQAVIARFPLDNKTIPYTKAEVHSKSRIEYWFGFLNNTNQLDDVVRRPSFNAKRTNILLDESITSSKVLTKVLDSLHFERNKDFFKKVATYYKDVQKYGSEKQDTVKAIMAYNLSNKEIKERMYVFASNIPSKSYIEIINERNLRYKARDMAFIPIEYGLGIYFAPSILVDGGF